MATGPSCQQGTTVGDCRRALERSSLAIVFAEALSDFGVATTLAKTSKFPVAAVGIYTAVQACPVQLGVVAAISRILLAVIMLGFGTLATGPGQVAKKRSGRG